MDRKKWLGLSLWFAFICWPKIMVGTPFYLKDISSIIINSHLHADNLVKTTAIYPIHIKYLPADTVFKTPSVPYKITLKRAAIPLVLLGLGLATEGKHPILPFNNLVQREAQQQFKGFETNIDDYLQHAPLVAAYGLKLAGIKGKYNLVNFTAVYTISTYLSHSISKNVKTFTHEMRPDSSSADGFPSGHTTSAFTKATLLYLEYKDENIWYGVGGYAVATATGALRIMNNRHWFSDVVAGAGLGILSTQFVYHIYPWIQRKVSQEVLTLSSHKVEIYPVYNQVSMGLGFMYQIK